MTPLILRKHDVIRNAIRAHKQGRLAATSKLAVTETECRYRYDDGRHCCVIGASMPALLARKFDKLDDSSIGVVISRGLVATRSAKFLHELQRAHDACLANTFTELEENRARLLAMLGIKS